MAESGQVRQKEWKAVSKQLVIEEQQAVNTAANKKAKKLKQKLNKQQAQHAATHSSVTELPVNDVSCTADTASDASTLEHKQQDSSPQAAFDGLPLNASPGTGSTAGNTADSSASSTARSAAGSIADNDQQESCLPVSNAKPVAANAEMQVSKQAVLHLKEPDNSMDDASFLRELFRCPITQVSPRKH